MSFYRVSAGSGVVGPVARRMRSRLGLRAMPPRLSCSRPAACARCVCSVASSGATWGTSWYGGGEVPRDSRGGVVAGRRRAAMSARVQTATLSPAWAGPGGLGASTHVGAPGMRAGSKTGQGGVGRESYNVVRFVDEDGNESYGTLVDGTGEGIGEAGAWDAAARPIQQLGDHHAWKTLDEQRRIARFLPPVEPVSIYCIGLNYHGHAAETGLELPRYPVYFLKPITSVIAHRHEIVIPAVAREPPEVDFEGELAVVIGRDCKDVSPAEALDYVLGYTIANDVSARRWQGAKGGGQWCRAKAFDTFCPLGPGVVPANRVNPDNLRLVTRLNGEIMQDSSTADMVFSVPQLISFLSQDTTLLHGTVILTGTPEGVGFTRKPPVYLQPGDVVEVEIEGLGTLANRVVSERTPSRHWVQ